MHRRIALLSMAVLAAGCASYTPAPIDVDAVATRQQLQTLDPARVRAVLARIAPDYQWPGDEWNTLSLLAAALDVNPAIGEARAAVTAAQAAAATARTRPGPGLTLTTEYASNPPEASNWLYGLASDLLIDRGGRREGRIELADLAIQSAAYDYAAAVWSLRMAIRQAVDARTNALAEAEAAGELVAMRRRQFDAVNRQVAAGELSRLELDRVRGDLAADTRRELEARARAERAGIELAAAVGLRPTALPLDRVTSSSGTNPSALDPLNDRQIADALELRTEILQAAAAYDRSEADLRIAVAAQYPAISIGPGYTWERGLAKLPFNVSLTLPGRSRARAEIAAAEARRSAAGSSLEAVVASVVASIYRADADYRAALETLRLVQTETLPTAAALARQSDRELEAGAINRAEWAASQAGLLTARLDEIAAAFAVANAETALEGALRRPLRGPETIIGGSTFVPPEESDP